MEAKFVVHRIVRRQDMVSFARILYAKIRIAYCILALLYAALLAYNIYMYYWYVHHTILLLLCVLLGLYAAFYPRIAGWRIWRSRNQKIRDCVLEFCDDGMRVSSDQEEGTIQYNVFLRLVENDDHFFLFIQKYSAHILPKDQFVQGDPAKFSAFIAEKTGLEVKRVKG